MALILCVRYQQTSPQGSISRFGDCILRNKEHMRNPEGQLISLLYIHHYATLGMTDESRDISDV